MLFVIADPILEQCFAKQPFIDPILVSIEHIQKFLYCSIELVTLSELVRFKRLWLVLLLLAKFVFGILRLFLIIVDVGEDVLVKVGSFFKVVLQHRKKHLHFIAGFLLKLANYALQFHRSWIQTNFLTYNFSHLFLWRSSSSNVGNKMTDVIQLSALVTDYLLPLGIGSSNY